MPRQAAPEIGSVANSDLATNVQRPVRNSELPDKSFAASESPSVVQQWLEGVQRLDYVRFPLRSRQSVGSYFWEIAIAS
jgi:hypothetical protein